MIIKVAASCLARYQLTATYDRQLELLSPYNRYNNH